MSARCGQRLGARCRAIRAFSPWWGQTNGGAMGLPKILAAALAAAACTAAVAPPRGDIRIDDTHVYPESLSAAADGTVYVGSIKGMVFRARPGSATAEPWVQPEGVLS